MLSEDYTIPRVQLAANFRRRPIDRSAWTLTRSSETALTEAEAKHPFAEWVNGLLRVRERVLVVSGALFHQVALNYTRPTPIDHPMSEIEMVKRLFCGADRYACLVFPPRQEAMPDGAVHLWVMLRPHAHVETERQPRGYSLTPRFAVELEQEPMP